MASDMSRKAGNVPPTPVTVTNSESPIFPVPVSAEDPEPETAHRNFITTIIEHCNAIYTFASRYASLSHTSPPSTASYEPSRNRNPPPAEVREMTQRAQLVLDLVDRIRGVKSALEPQHSYWSVPEGKRARIRDPGAQGYLQAQDASIVPLQSPSRAISGIGSYPYDELDSKDPEARSEAERDMLTIRSKRSAAAAVAAANASASSGGGNGGPLAGVLGGAGDKLVKKSRKRGRTPLPGKCHSCNIRETPEWRRGPDGARTLCNACGLHYAKLVRKRDKALMSSNSGPSEAEAKPVDMEMVRASSQRNGGQAPQYSPLGTDTKGHFTHQVSGGSQPPSVSIDTSSASMDLYSRQSNSAISPHDPYQVSNAAYSISSYSSLTPQRMASQRQAGTEQQIGGWDGSGGLSEGRYIRNFRSNTRDEIRDAV